MRNTKTYIGVFCITLGALTVASCSKDAPKTTNEAPKTTVQEQTPPTQIAAEKPQTIEKATAAILTPEAAGKKIFRRCQACHTVNEGGKHRVGPNLWGIYDKKAGSSDGFAYSKAMIASEVIWTDETLDAYITSPKNFIPKNKMQFIGLKKEEDRKNLLAYLSANTK